MHILLGLTLFGFLVALHELAALSETGRRLAVAQNIRGQVPIKAIVKAATEKFGRLDLLFCLVSVISCVLAGISIWLPILVSLALFLTQVMYYHSVSADRISSRLIWSMVHGVLLVKGALLPPIFAVLATR